MQREEKIEKLRVRIQTEEKHNKSA